MVYYPAGKQWESFFSTWWDGCLYYEIVLKLWGHQRVNNDTPTIPQVQNILEMKSVIFWDVGHERHSERQGLAQSQQQSWALHSGVQSLSWSDQDSFLISKASVTESFSVDINSPLMDRTLGMHCRTVRF